MNRILGKLGAAGFVATVTALSMVGVASAQEAPDPLTGAGGAIETVQTKLVGYAGPVVAAVVAIGLAWLVVRIAPKVIKFIGSKI